MPRNNTVKVLNPKRQLMRFTSPQDAAALINSGSAEPINPDNWAKGVIVGVKRNESQQGIVLESLAAEKFPQIVVGGLTRTEHKPVIRKHLPRLQQWFPEVSR